VFSWNGDDGSNPGGCAGTLVATNWVVTAAHCFFDPSTGQQNTFADTMSVVIGEHKIRKPNGRVSDNDEFDTLRKNLKIEKIIIHNKYNNRKSKNDIALLKLEENLDLSTYTPACLPSKGEDWTGEEGWVYGWGVESESASKLSYYLRDVSVTVITNEDCADNYGNAISADMMCATKEDKDACQGDSGGPYTVDVSGRHYLAGVVSWGNGCARPGYPGVYADVSYQRDWIDEQIEENGGADICQP